MADKEKTCVQCGKAMTGRADKRFCSDQCRATAANVRKFTEEGELLIRNVNRVLRRNRQLLRQAIPVGKTTIRRQVSSLAGFNFHYFTHIYRTKQGNHYYFCYDYGYLLLPQEDKVLIVNWQQYMEPRENAY